MADARLRKAETPRRRRGAVRVTVRRRVKAPVHLAWARLSDLGALSRWAPGVVASKAGTLRIGARRVATLRKPAYGKAELVETVNALRPHGFTYDIEGGIGPMPSVVTGWDLLPRGDGGASCVVQVQSDVALAGGLRFAKPLAWLAWRRRLSALAKGFARYAESA
jgi:carbon monoxide dehydrogenase subunit G